MKGALSDLGVELVRVAQPQSVTQECSVVAGASVEAASYAGGFAGAFSNSYSINDTISGPVAVRATIHSEESGDEAKSYALAGGFAGAATLGWVSDLGKSENAPEENNLIGLVGDLLTDVLEGKDSDGRRDALLTLWALTNPPFWARRYLAARLRLKAPAIMRVVCWAVATARLSPRQMTPIVRN